MLGRTTHPPGFHRESLAWASVGRLREWNFDIGKLKKGQATRGSGAEGSWQSPRNWSRTVSLTAE